MISVSIVHGDEQNNIKSLWKDFLQKKDTLYLNKKRLDEIYVDKDCKHRLWLVETGPDRYLAVVTRRPVITPRSPSDGGDTGPTITTTFCHLHSSSQVLLPCDISSYIIRQSLTGHGSSAPRQSSGIDVRPSACSSSSCRLAVSEKDRWTAFNMSVTVVTVNH